METTTPSDDFEFELELEDEVVDVTIFATEATLVGLEGLAAWHLKQRFRTIPFAKVAKFWFPQLSHNQSDDSSSLTTEVIVVEMDALEILVLLKLELWFSIEEAVVVVSAGTSLAPKDFACDAADVDVDVDVDDVGFLSVLSSHSIWRHVLA